MEDPQFWIAIASSVSALATICIAYAAYFQLAKVAQQVALQKDTLEGMKKHETDFFKWSKRKATQEVLENITLGRFAELQHTAEHDLKCHIYADGGETFETKRRILYEANSSEVHKLDSTIGQMLNILENFCILIKHNIIDEDICYDYFGWILVQYHNYCKSYIEEMNKKANDTRIYASFVECAMNWQKRINDEKEPKKVPPKLAVGELSTPSQQV